MASAQHSTNFNFLEEQDPLFVELAEAAERAFSRLKGINKQAIVRSNIPAKPMTTCSYAQVVRVFYAWDSPKYADRKRRRAPSLNPL